MTLPLQIALQWSVGASIAWVFRLGDASENILRSSALAVLLLLQATMVVPVGAYFLWRFPDWSLMYAVLPESVPKSPMTLAALYPLSAVGGMWATHRALQHQRRTVGLGLLALGGVCALFFGWLLRARLGVVGTTMAFRLGPESLTPMRQTPLPYVAAAASVALAIAWGFALHRMMLLARAESIRHEDKKQAPRPLEPGAKTLPPQKAKVAKRAANRKVAKRAKA